MRQEHGRGRAPNPRSSPARAQGALDETPLSLVLERDRAPASPLAFPGKVVAAASGRVFIADSAPNEGS